MTARSGLHCSEALSLCLHTGGISDMLIFNVGAVLLPMGKPSSILEAVHNLTFHLWSWKMFPYTISILLVSKVTTVKNHPFKKHKK